MTWAELFFDLVFVFAVTQVSALLHVNHSWAGVFRALVVFVPIWWGWVGTSIHANTHDVDNPLDRLGIFAVGLCSLFLALATPHAFGAHGVLFGGAYLALRLLLAALVFRGPRMSPNSFSVGLLVTGPLFLLGGFLGGGTRIAVWALAALIDLSVPALVRRRLARVQFDAHHLPERFGLFLIIALGESIVAVGNSVDLTRSLTTGAVAAVAASFALACALWWVYFVFAASAVRHAVATAAVQTDIIRQVLAYGHFVFVAAIIAVAVGMAEVVHHPDHHLGSAIAGLLFGGTALYLATFGYTRWRMFRIWSVSRLGAAAVVLLLLPISTLMPALVALIALVAVVVSLNIIEYHRVRRARARDGADYLGKDEIPIEPAPPAFNSAAPDGPPSEGPAPLPER